MIELASCSMDRELFMRMARDYVEALSKYDSEIVWDEMTWSKAAWYAQFIVEDRTVQGFVITEINTFAVFPPAMCIAEFYVVPEARNRHIGTHAVEAVMKSWDGDVFLYILDQNRPARFFWTDVEAELGWTRIERPEIREEPGCELRVYKT